MTRSLTIAQVCADRGIAPGGTKGAARHLAGVAAGLAGLGHLVTTYTSRAPEGSHPVRVLGLDALGESQPDVVYERYSLSSGAGLRHARATGAAFVLEVNAPLVDEATQHRSGTVDESAPEREAMMMAAADLVITVSRPLAGWIGRFRTGPTVVIPNGFEPAWFPSPATHELGDHRVAFLGHPKPWHGANRIPYLVQRLNEMDLRVHVVVIGGGDGAEDLRRIATSFGIDSQIEITGAVRPEVASRLVATTAVGLAPYPSIENFYFSPLKILDYLAAAVPVVSTNQGDIAELVGPGGIVVADPNDDDAVADSIATLLADPSRRTQMGSAARKHVFATRTWEHVARDTAAALGYARIHAGKASCS